MKYGGTMSIDYKKLEQARTIMKSNSKQLDDILLKYFSEKKLCESSSMKDHNDFFSVNLFKQRIPTAERMTPMSGLSLISDQKNHVVKK